MKKLLISLLLIVLLVPTLAFAANPTNVRDLYESVVGSEPVRGQRLSEQAEAAGKGEEFFNAMQADRTRYFTELADEGVLTQEEADFMIDKMSQTYAEHQKMQQIQDKLFDAGYGKGFGQGKGMKGGNGPMNGRGQGNYNCPMAPGN